MIRASALRDLVGDIQRELLTTGPAIIDYKIVVVDPLSKEHCVVIMGSHNLGLREHARRYSDHCSSNPQSHPTVSRAGG
jgi:hypothetical protein